MSTDETGRRGENWIAAFADRCGLAAPDDDTVATLLELAGVAAHVSERIAAPIACWLVGQSGMSAADALALAREI